MNEKKHRYSVVALGYDKNDAPNSSECIWGIHCDKDEAIKDAKSLIETKTKKELIGKGSHHVSIHVEERQGVDGEFVDLIWEGAKF